MSKPPAPPILPRVIRAKHAPSYLGMSREVFNRDVKPFVTVVPIGFRRGWSMTGLNWTLGYTMAHPERLTRCIPAFRAFGPALIALPKQAVLPVYRTRGRSQHPEFAIQKNPVFSNEVFMYGAPGEIRTPDQVVRSHLLYPAELRVHGLCSLYCEGRK